LSNFNIARAAGGNYIATIKGFTATAGTGGTIRIQFSPILRSLAEINGIEVLPAGS